MRPSLRPRPARRTGRPARLSPELVPRVQPRARARPAARAATGPRRPRPSRQPTHQMMPIAGRRSPASKRAASAVRSMPSSAISSPARRISTSTRPRTLSLTWRTRPGRQTERPRPAAGHPRDRADLAPALALGRPAETPTCRPRRARFGPLGWQDAGRGAPLPDQQWTARHCPRGQSRSHRCG